MKKWFMLNLVLIYLVGCTSNIGGTGNNTTKGNGGGSTTNSSNTIVNPPQPATAVKRNGPVEITIPSSNESAPNGILDQLAWAGQGGPGGPDQPCGECFVSLEHSSLTLKSFSPSQHLKLVIYRRTGHNSCWDTAEYVTSISVQVDENGYFNSSLTGPVANLFVVLIFDLDTNTEIWGRPSEYRYLECAKENTAEGECPGAPTQRLEVNKMAYVCTASDTVKLREEPNKGSTILKSLVPGADVKVIGGPHCENNWSWWQVRTESGYEGWMSEGGDEVDPYFLCPRN